MPKFKIGWTGVSMSDLLFYNSWFIGRAARSSHVLCTGIMDAVIISYHNTRVYSSFHVPLP